MDELEAYSYGQAVIEVPSLGGVLLRLKPMTAMTNML